MVPPVATSGRRARAPTSRARAGRARSHHERRCRRARRTTPDPRSLISCIGPCTGVVEVRRIASPASRGPSELPEIRPRSANHPRDQRGDLAEPVARDTTMLSDLCTAQQRSEPRRAPERVARTRRVAIARRSRHLTIGPSTGLALHRAMTGISIIKGSLLALSTAAALTACHHKSQPDPATPPPPANGELGGGSNDTTATPPPSSGTEATPQGDPTQPPQPQPAPTQPPPANPMPSTNPMPPPALNPPPAPGSAPSPTP